jgi:hypothetical protein
VGSLEIAAALVAAAVLAGCIEVREDFTLNPDGSGKVAVDFLMQEAPAGAGQADKPDPAVLAKQTVRHILDTSPGVDAWADVSYSRAEDGRLHFKGTAYFKDFSPPRLKIADLLGVTCTREEKGGMTLLVDRPAEAAKTPAAHAPAAKLTKEEIDRRVKAQRDGFRQKRPWLEQVLAKTRIEMSFRLPGTPGDVTNLQKGEDGTLRFVLEGPKLLPAIDQLVADNAYMREMVVSETGAGQGGARLSMSNALNEKLFGARAPIRVRVTGDFKPLFDYAAEVKAAKDAYPKMLERLGLAALPSAPPAK